MNTKVYSKVKELINTADYIVIGAGSGLSASSGILYSGDKFNKDFKKWIDKYHIKDLYTSSFYPFETEEEYWAYWAKHIYYSYYERQDNKLYKELFNLVKDKNYFVITTNTDGMFINNRFDQNKVFEVQGSYSKIQCINGCHNKLYDNKNLVYKMLDSIDDDLKISTNLVPKCPVCGKNMMPNLRCDDNFVEDEYWNEHYKKYTSFINKAKNKKILLLEFGVGYNTPGIIRFPFEELVTNNINVKLVRINDKYCDNYYDIKDNLITIKEDCKIVIEELNKL